jgi:hypothetical protein
MRRELCRSECAAIGHIAAGMLIGTGIVAVATVAERIAYVGLFDFSRAYRTTALFWEMHVGGAAIDGYLALAWPVVAWAVLRAQTPSRWAPAAMLAVFVEYACLTTFSRGLYVAVAGGIVVLFMGLRRQGPPSLPRWRRNADAILAAVLVPQFALVGSEPSACPAEQLETDQPSAWSIGGMASICCAPRRIGGWKGSGRLRSDTEGRCGG